MAKKNNKAYTKPGRATRGFGEITDLIDNVWNEISSFQDQKWEVPKNKKPLTDLIGKDETDRLYAITDDKAQNVHLRTLLVNPLKDKNQDKRVQAINWIVVRWGRIPAGSKNLIPWVDEFKDYDDKTVESFINKLKKDRVSSWSKILAFADSTKYAIFDTRVAMSLNMILEKTNYSDRFFMPSSRDEELNGLFKNVRDYVGKLYENKNPKYLDYFDYLDLLRAIVEKKPKTNILDVEMRLFANSKRLAIEYAEKHKIAYKEDKKS